MARFVLRLTALSTRMRLGSYDRLRSRSPPRRGRPAALGPTRSRVARNERTCDSDDSERAGGEEAAARATTSKAKTCPAKQCQLEQAYQLLPRPMLPRKGVLDQGRGRARRRRRNAPTCNKRVVLIRSAPALDLSCTVYQQDKTCPAAN